MAGKDEEESNLEKAMDTGAEAAGSLVGAGLGFALAGPAGAILGAIVAPISTALIKVGGEAIRSRISQREEVRTGTVLYVATAAIKQKMDDGKKIRSDEFFEKKNGGRSSAEEVIEATILAAQKSFEERKIPFLGTMLANIALDESIKSAEANRLVGLGERLSYTQLCILKIFALTIIAPGSLKLRTNAFPDGNYSSQFLATMTELWELYRESMIVGEGGLNISWLHLNLSQLKTAGLGATLYNLMELHRIPMDDINVVLSNLRTGIPEAPAA